MGEETRLTKLPTRVSGTTPGSSPYTVTRYMDSKDLQEVLMWSRMELTLRVFGLETNTSSVRVYVETSMYSESEDSSAWVIVVDFGAVTTGNTYVSMVTAPPAAGSVTLLRYVRWRAVLTGSGATVSVGATFEILGVGRQ